MLVGRLHGDPIARVNCLIDPYTTKKTLRGVREGKDLPPELIIKPIFHHKSNVTVILAPEKHIYQKFRVIFGIEITLLEI